MNQAQVTFRREDARLLTGYGRYVADFHAEGELHAHFLRSDRVPAQSSFRLRAYYRERYASNLTIQDVSADQLLFRQVRT